MMSSCSKRKLQRAKERERWREGREKQMSIKPRNGKSMFARGPSSSLSHSVYYWLRPRFYIMANPRARIWETKKNAQNFRKKTEKVLQKWKKIVRWAGFDRSIDRLWGRCATISATRADDREGRPSNTNSSLCSDCFFFSPRFWKFSYI